MKSKKLRVAAGAGMASVMALTVLPEPALADTASDEAAFVAKLNGLRASRGLHGLGVNGSLTSMARSWSSQMAARGTIFHNGNMAAQAPGNWVRLGENVGMGPSVDALHNAFVGSPSHYANMVNPHYTSVGVGVVQSGATKFVTFNFMASGGAPAAVPAASPRRSSAAVPTRRVCRRARRGRVVCRQVKARPARKGRSVRARKGRSTRKAVKVRRTSRRAGRR